MRASVYRNLNRKCWSVQRPGERVQHHPTLALRNVTFAVQPSGQRRARRERQRNVHAFARGEVTTPPATLPAAARLVGYDPFEDDHFTCGGALLCGAALVVFAADGRCWAVLDGGDPLFPVAD